MILIANALSVPIPIPSIWILANNGGDYISPTRSGGFVLPIAYIYMIFDRAHSCLCD
jgi:hypothetical protein